MCLILVAWQAHPDYPLVVAANRDEFFARPAAAAAWWPDAPDVFAGRDLEAVEERVEVVVGRRVDALREVAQAAPALAVVFAGGSERAITGVGTRGEETRGAREDDEGKGVGHVFRSPDAGAEAGIGLGSGCDW